MAYTTFQSDCMILLYINRPIPGMLKMTSMIRPPAKASGILLIIIVMVDIIEFGSICFHIAFHLLTPLAFSVVA